MDSGLDEGTLIGPRAAASERRSNLPDRALERHLGATMKAQRLRLRLTIADVSAQAEISRGMLSKIENGKGATSLDTLSRLAGALGLSLYQLFRDYDTPAGAAQLVRAGAGLAVVRRGTKRGHAYHLLAYDRGPRRSFEPFLITMDDASEVFPRFEHAGTEFIHVLSGQLEYRHGRETYLLRPGDSLTFRGDVPHGPERLLKLPIQFLSVIVYGSEDA